MDFDLDFDQEKSGLSRAEWRVYMPMVLGFTRKAIAGMLYLSEETINTHISHIHQKLNVDNTQQAITAGFVRGIVKAKKALVLCLAISLTEQALYPPPVSANDLSPEPLFQAYMGGLGHGSEFIRLRHRGRSRGRTGSARRGRRREQSLSLDMSQQLAFDSTFFNPASGGVLR